MSHRLDMSGRDLLGQENNVAEKSLAVPSELRGAPASAKHRFGWIWLTASLLLVSFFCLFSSPPKPVIPLLSLGPRRVQSQVAVGGDQALLLAPDGSLWTWGGTLAAAGITRGSAERLFAPRRVGTNSDWTAIAIRNRNALALREDGTLWGWHSKHFDLAPTPLSSETNWQAIAASLDHIVALKKDGTCWIWKSVNVLGRSRTVEPRQIGGGFRWTAVCAGVGYGAAVREDGTLWAWGSLGYPPTSQPLTQIGAETNWVSVCSGDYDFMARKRDGSCWLGSASRWVESLLHVGRPLQWGEVVRAPALDDMDGPLVFRPCALGINSDGTLWGYGVNFAKPVLMSNRQDWAAIGASPLATIGLTHDGTVWTWGTRFDRPPLLPHRMNRLLAASLARMGVPLNWNSEPAYDETTSFTPILRFVDSNQILTNHARAR